jgi:hypothetical protein
MGGRVNYPSNYFLKNGARVNFSGNYFPIN